jgi:sugar diacid utilization regulator
MPTVRDLLVIADRYAVELLAPSELQRASTKQITRIVILQNIAALRTIPENSLVIVPAGLFTRQDSSGLDILIRRVSERAGIAVLVQGLVRTQTRLERLATRFEVAVLGCPETVDLGDLVTTLNHTLAGGPADVLVRAWRGLDRIGRWEDETDVDAADLVGEVGEIIGEPLRFGTDVDGGAPIIVNGREVARLGTGKDGEPTPELRIVRPALQYAIAVRMMRADLRERVVRDDQARALAALIVADASTVEHYAALARRIDVDVDGHHCAVTVKTAADDPVTRDAQLHDAEAALARATAALSVDLRTARVERDLVVVFTGRAGRQIDEAAISAGVRAAIVVVPSLHWGLGTEHVGPGGLRSTVSEARSAANAAAAEGVTTRPVAFDVSGIQRLISEARASVTAGRVAAELLAPLSALSNPGASIETLNVWLEERGSLKAAAARLHLHPNAVAYRISRIESTLGADLGDADTRFALQFACRIATSDRPPAD